MSHSAPASELLLLEAINALKDSRATAIRDNTLFRLPVTMRIQDADFCTYLARNQSSFRFLPSENAFNTRLVLRTTYEAWKHDKLPTIAICPTSSVAEALQMSTGIESLSADTFLGDLQQARVVTQTFTGKKDYVIGHDSNRRGRVDEVVLPAAANVIVYNAEDFPAEQIAALCDPIATVRGRLILCGDQQAVNTAFPQIAPLLNSTLDRALSEIKRATGSVHPERAWELGTTEEVGPVVENPVAISNESSAWVVVAACNWRAGASSVRSIHSSKEEALNDVPAVFAEEWREYKLLLEAGWTDVPSPLVSVAEWKIARPPEVGDPVRVDDDAAVSVLMDDDYRTVPDHLREDVGELDPLATRRAFLVFHATSEDSTSFPDHYTLVARIEAESVEHARRLSQHSDVSWPRHRGVTPFVEDPRSTQFGDVIIDHDVPLHYVGPNQWRPAKAEMDVTDVSPVKAELDGAHYEHEPQQLSTAPQRIRI